MSDDSYQKGIHLEAAEHLERTRTAGGHPVDNSQPQLPVYHRKLANPTPLGLFSFATGIFFISCMGVEARSVKVGNMMISFMIFYGGVCQFLVGIMEFIAGNTFGATVFSSYGAFNLTYGLVYLPGSGIIAAYTDPVTGQLTEDFNQALGLYYLAWAIVTFCFVLGAVRASVVVLSILSFFDLECILLAAGLMSGNTAVLKAANAVGFVVSFCCFYGGASGLYDGTTPWNLPTIALHKDQ